MTDRHRLLELALKGLENEQTRIQEEINAINSELRGEVPSPRRRRPQAPNKGKTMSLAQRRKISAAMKRRWAARKAD